jgi:hypothetical protein
VTIVDYCWRGKRRTYLKVRDAGCPIEPNKPVSSGMKLTDVPSWRSIFHAAVLGVALGVWWVMPAFGPQWGFNDIAEFVAVLFVVIRATRYFITGRLLVE